MDSLTFSCTGDADCMPGYKCIQEQCVDPQSAISDASLEDSAATDSAHGDQNLEDSFIHDSAISDHFVDEDSAVVPDAGPSDLGHADSSLLDADNLDSSSEDLGNFEDANLIDGALEDAQSEDAQETDAQIGDVQEADAFVPNCVDQDGDGFDAYDATDCPSGQDYCDDKKGLSDDEECRACNHGCKDIDGDGYWSGGDLSNDTYAHFDCDDSLPTCTNDCSDADGDGQSDCLEDFCGSDPAASLSTCHLINSVEDWDNAVSSSADNGQDDFFLLGDISVSSSNGLNAISDTENLSIRQRAGHTIDKNSDSRVITVSGEHVSFETLHITGGTTSIYINQGNNCTIKDCIFDGFSNRAVYVYYGENVSIDNLHATGGSTSIYINGGDYCTVKNSVFEGFSDSAVEVYDGEYNTIINNDMDCASASDSSGYGVYVHGSSADQNDISSNNLNLCHFGLYIYYAQNTTMDHNNIVCGGSSQDDSRGLYFDDTTNTKSLLNNVYHCERGICMDDNDTVTIDNNSLVQNYAAVYFKSSTSDQNICIRDNIFSDNGVAFNFSSTPGWAGNSCKVDGHYRYKNNLNGVVMCAGDCLAFADSESDCSSCLPGNATFFPYQYDPAFISLDPNEAGAFCPSETALLESGNDLGHDFIFPYGDAENFYDHKPPVGSCDLPQ